ncbi:glutaminyl-tRNA synthetase, putative [Eimeria maxima]|uniref:Glutaminyl-tRNA synthetase, putative n=1 Tax=Eimeria maxima TaxID=5804 RepID=U6MJB5_EIMMA|nr:glutaminyl-tRNA synthetase, putative [Eimeria maxima]CDJ61745.1 glutaminyl-tRNA synthetase, putative [Eimeria maxima]
MTNKTPEAASAAATAATAASSAAAATPVADGAAPSCDPSIESSNHGVCESGVSGSLGVSGVSGESIEGTIPSNFLAQIMQNDLATGKCKEIVTRFPPEPNGFLHLGHAKSICINFGLAKIFNGKCHMRFDDTNPTKEETRMRDGVYEEGQCVLRAKIDMAHKNVIMRDPIMYRILKKEHPRTGSDFLLYIDSCMDVKLLSLVEEKIVDGWDDPRLPTLSALRRRGVPAAAIKEFCDRVGVARRNSVIQLELFERCIREYVDERAPRRFAIKEPLLIKLINYKEEEGKEEILNIPNDPKKPEAGCRQLAFTKELYIDAEDFMENPPKNFYRLSPGKEVRLRSAYWIKCEQVEKDANGKITALICTYDPQTLNCSSAPDGRKVKGTIHWLPAKYAVPGSILSVQSIFQK